MRLMIAAPWGAGEAIKPSLRGVMMIAFSVPFPGKSLGFFLFCFCFFTPPTPFFLYCLGIFYVLLRKFLLWQVLPANAVEPSGFLPRIRFYSITEPFKTL